MDGIKKTFAQVKAKMKAKREKRKTNRKQKKLAKKAGGYAIGNRQGIGYSNIVNSSKKD